MKRMLAVLLSLMMLLPLVACEEAESSTSSSQYTQSQSQELTASEIERLAAKALLTELKSTVERFKNYSVDPNSCKYSINKTEKDGDNTYVYGTVYFYDKYGQLTDLLGDYSHSFKATVYYKGSAYCKIYGT